MSKKANYYLRRISGVIAWILVALFVVYTLSGYGIANPNTVSELTGGIFTRTISVYLHNTLDLPILTLVLIHVLIQLRFTLLRWNVEDGILLNSFIIILGIFALALLLIMDTRFF